MVIPSQDLVNLGSTHVSWLMQTGPNASDEFLHVSMSSALSRLI